MLTEDGDDFVLQSEYYYIGHFSRFIRPGAVCLATSAWSSHAEVTAVGKMALTPRIPRLLSPLPIVGTKPLILCFRHILSLHCLCFDI